MTKKIIILIAPLFLMLFPFFLPDEYRIFPGDEELSMVSFTDAANNGHSEILDLHTGKEAIRFSFRLNAGYPYPYTGFGMTYKNGVKDIRSYDKVKIKLKTNLHRVRINFYYYLEGFTRSDGNVTHLMTEGWITPQKGKEEYTLNFQNFIIPQWWYEFHQLPESYENKIDYTTFRGVEFTATDVTMTGQAKFIEISTLSLHRNKTVIFALTGIALVAIYLFMLLHLKRKGRLPFIKTVTPALPPCRMESIDEHCYQNLNNYLCTFYTNPELSLETVKKELGLSTRKINAFLKARTNCTFKKYLNRLRIEKARQLLRETGKSITAIAYETGFNNQTHFHRIFKEQEGVSPGEFRKRSI